jgi:cytochrome b6-f complex iron-sulfur subunit
MQPGRRRVLDWLLGGWATSVMAAIGYPIARYLVPPALPEAPTRTVTGGKASTLAPNSSRIIPFGSAPAIVLRTPGGDLRAFTGTCTHLACTVQYRPDLQHVWCACHNGHYDLNGRNIAGPPPRPLEEYDVRVKDDEIVVSRKG